MLLGQLSLVQRIQLLLKDNVTFYAVVAILVLIILVCLIQIWRRRKSPAQPRSMMSDNNNIPPVKQNVSSIMKDVPPPVVETKNAPPAFEVPTYNQGTTSQLNTAPVNYGYKAPVAPEAKLPEIDKTTLPTTDRSALVFGGMTEPLSTLLPEGDETKSVIKEELVHAGYFSPFAWHNLAAIRYLGIVLPLIFCGILLVLVPPELEFYVVCLMIVLPILGWAVPRLYVRNQAKERLSQIEYGMPDMIDMLNMCVSQGLPLLPSMNKVATELKEVHPALSKELAIVTKQAEVGNIKHALHNFSKRTNSQEVHSFTSLLLQTEQMGTSVSEALGTYSDNMRSTLNQRAEQKANTASFKLLFPTVLCFMPAVFMFLLGPAIVELSNFYYGSGRMEIRDNTRNAISIINAENNLP